jgi:hypothetical protein
MRTPKRLYAQQRLVYQPEWPTCPHCGGVLVMCNYLVWDKTVQTLDQVLSVASRPGRCSDETCPGSHMRLLSAQAQSIAIPGSTYGYDVLVRIGWLRYHARATYTEIHRELVSQVRISESHIRYLYQHLYLPLLACHERQHRDHLAQVAELQGGLMIALDGLAPQGGEPQIWFIRELTSGLTLRSGWLCKQDQPTFEAFLRPLKLLEWPILAVLSDKQTGLMPAVRTVFPNSHYQFCQAHYLRNLAEPLAEIDSAFKVDLRKAVRQHVGNLIRQEPRCDPKQASVLTVTGLLPSPISMPNVSGVSVAQSAIELPPEVEADAVIMQLLRRTRYLLTLKGRPPFRLAGMATYERLDEVASLSLDLLTQRYDPRLAQLYQGLQSALLPFTQTYQDLQQGAAWLRDIAYILEPVSPQALKGEQVAAQLHGYLGAIRCQHDVSPAICDFTLHLDKVTRSYWPGLFHCYEVAGLPRTNNEIESHFRDTGRQILRITGQKGLTGRTLQRQGAWELLPRPATEAKLLNGLSQIPPEDLAQERQRFAQHRERFRLQSQSTRQTQIQFAQLRQRWAALSPTGTG